MKASIRLRYGFQKAVAKLQLQLKGLHKASIKIQSRLNSLWLNIKPYGSLREAEASKKPSHGSKCKS